MSSNEGLANRVDWGKKKMGVEKNLLDLPIGKLLWSSKKEFQWSAGRRYSITRSWRGWDYSGSWNKKTAVDIDLWALLIDPAFLIHGAASTMVPHPDSFSPAPLVSHLSPRKQAHWDILERVLALVVGFIQESRIPAARLHWVVAFSPPPILLAPTLLLGFSFGFWIGIAIYPRVEEHALNPITSCLGNWLAD